eukprot:CAMPEP_0202911534 /NCGR_PEP_ID=MMETSP1392-20130828/55244_1 /ASSEMBLY_ACC=CAM_ASM_000868 /TAXON_ID=225041 /ORGANISM="Chlamydomonas chlamydogama, Strain SAG 11-48b" /LENGTH=123 /DNA_ID=CAMNT_0049602083 /DNA_START=317 /DNA_END=688 /DNA_ORIENTATION=-
MPVTADSVGSLPDFEVSSSQSTVPTPMVRRTDSIAPPSLSPEYVPEAVIKEFESKLQSDLTSVGATVFAGIGVITWWRGVWALLDHYVGDSVVGHWACIITGLMIIMYVRVAGYKLTNLFPPS